MARNETLERRESDVKKTDFVLRKVDNADPVFTGHAAVFGQRTAIGNPLSWGFLEEVDSGAFDRTLASADPRFLVDHDTAMLVARSSAGDLRLQTDDIGLDTSADMDLELSYVRDLVRNLEKRRITGMSFGFEVKKDRWDVIEYEAKDDAGNTILVPVDLRVLLDVELWEVSAVTFPAYDATDAALRAISGNPDVVRRREERLRTERPANGSTIGRCLDLMAELRAGKILSKANVELLQSVLDRLDTASDGLGTSRTDLSGLLGVDDPSDTESNSVTPSAAETPDQADDRRRRIRAYAIFNEIQGE